MRGMLALGADLLKLFFDERARRSSAPSPGANGTAALLHSWRERTYVSVFGPVQICRRYYRAEGGAGVYPLDAELSLGRRCYSDLLRNWLEFAVTNEAYDQAVELLDRVLGFKIAKHALERLVKEDAGDVEAFYDQRRLRWPVAKGRSSSRRSMAKACGWSCVRTREPSGPRSAKLW